MSDSEERKLRSVKERIRIRSLRKITYVAIGCGVRKLDFHSLGWRCVCSKKKLIE